MKTPLRRVFHGFILAIAVSAGYAHAAATDCPVTLKNAFVGDVTGSGVYGLWLTYNYIASSGTTYAGQGYILLSSPAASAISAVVMEAQATQQLSVIIRYENSGGDSQDVVCEGSGRSDLAGVWLHQ